MLSGGLAEAFYFPTHPPTQLSVCKIPARQKFNCSASELTSPPQFDSWQGIGLLVQCLRALLKGQDQRPSAAARSVLGLLDTAAGLLSFCRTRIALRGINSERALPSVRVSLVSNPPRERTCCDVPFQPSVFWSFRKRVCLN